MRGTALAIEDGPVHVYARRPRQSYSGGSIPLYRAIEEEQPT